MTRDEFLKAVDEKKLLLDFTDEDVFVIYSFPEVEEVYKHIRIWYYNIVANIVRTDRVTKQSVLSYHIQITVEDLVIHWTVNCNSIAQVLEMMNRNDRLELAGIINRSKT